MGLITLVRGITRPIRQLAHQVNSQQASILDDLRCRRRAVAGAPAGKDGLWFPEDIGESQLSTYPCDPQNGDHPYKDQYRPLNQNPVSIAVNTPVQLALAWRNRAEFICVNVSLVTVLLGYGFAPTATNYTIPCMPCNNTANDGTGGIVISDAWKGAVFAFCPNGTGAVEFTEFPEEEPAK